MTVRWRTSEVDTTSESPCGLTKVGWKKCTLRGEDGAGKRVCWGFETPGKGAALRGESVRLKRPKRPLGGSMRLKRPKRPLGGSVRLKRPMRPLGGSVRLKRPMRPLGGIVRLKRLMRPLGGSVRLKRLMGPLGGGCALIALCALWVEVCA